MEHAGFGEKLERQVRRHESRTHVHLQQVETSKTIDQIRLFNYSTAIFQYSSHELLTDIGFPFASTGGRWNAEPPAL